MYQHAVISVGIDASSFGFQLYESGVYDDHQCGNKPSKLDHGVAITGFGVGEPQPPGPPVPPPGPANCMNNHYKIPCTKEKGYMGIPRNSTEFNGVLCRCHWCVEKSGFGYCNNVACDQESQRLGSVGAAVAAGNNSTKEFYMVKNSWGIIIVMIDCL